jgi:precorrin-2 dehydrogenase/sirohydrochlorin ferrochelatase
MIPEDVNKMVENLNEYRKTLKGNFEEKVQRMNEMTESLKKE